MSARNASDVREVLQALRAQGWRVDRTARRHLRARPPGRDRPIVITGGTPSDCRALANWIAQLRRSGFEWPPEAT